MNHADAYGPGSEDELPELPIPRPGEWAPLGAGSPVEEPPRIQPPRLGGGASFTAATDDPASVDTPTAAPGVPPLPPTHPERELAPSEQFVWTLAAQLTSGMLSNPARSHGSVKDAMGLFDQFLQEVHAYTRIASQFDLLGVEVDRRRAHEEYFRRGADRDQDAPVQPTAMPSPPAAQPTQPRPLGEYRPIPPGVRGPYEPGTMGGAAPLPASGDEDQQAA